ncbi:MAG: hypothetical protein EXS37_11510 [Opitutus sp.]|nr:hypothetical protein [Opitutus sp.]
MQSASPRLRFEPLDPRLRDLYRSATPTQKLAVVTRLNTTLIGLKEADIRARCPTISQKETRTQLRSWWLAARD